MELLFHLSGEHSTLPKAEALSLLRHRNALKEVVEEMSQLVICKVRKGSTEFLRNLAMTHEVLRHLGACRADKEEILRLGSQLEEQPKSFSVRVRRIGGCKRELSRLELEKELGSVIEGGAVDLEAPEMEIKGFLSSGRFALGLSLLKIDRGAFKERSPHRRPFFHPSSISPILARTVCNLCGVSRGKKVLDPFCGTGGLLIEAGLLGGEITGLDISGRMVEGCKRNLMHYGLRGRVLQGDAGELAWGEETFDIVVTDPPYGRSTSTLGWELASVYEKAVSATSVALRKGGMACIISPLNVKLEDMAERSGLTVLQSHEYPVHRSLTRRITIMRKR